MLIGRKPEIKRLEKVYQSQEAEFVVLYGRRRIGKTFLIRQFFEKKPGIFFQVTGSQKGSLQQQLNHFAVSLSETFTHGVMIESPRSWDPAFKALTQFIEADKSGNRITLFLDELPWLATPRGGLLTALDYYWNHYWARNPKIILVVCGSSASWLIKNIIYNRGGLHNRCTAEIKLNPFNLGETEAFLMSRGITLKPSHILDIYMALGGIPYYLSYVDTGLSAAQNIQKILCDQHAPLKDEFSKLFASLFNNANTYIELIKLIASKREGLSRSDLERLTQLSPGGGRLSEQLKQLEQTNFILSYIPWGKERGEYYKVIDEFCLFWLYWLEGSKIKERLSNFWVQQTQKQSYHAWAGYAFEAVCQKHIEQIIKALNIQSAEKVSTWRVQSKALGALPGAQIDLLIDRNDDAVTVCEIKYTEAPFVITREYADALKRKRDIFKTTTKTKKEVFMALISANGVTENQYFHEIISGLMTLDGLFQS